MGTRLKVSFSEKCTLLEGKEPFTLILGWGGVYSPVA
jgi:hypothetical protein